MAAEKKGKTDAGKKSGEPEPGDVPSLFRINVEVGNLDEAVEFYGKLFGLVGRKQAHAVTSRAVRSRCKSSMCRPRVRRTPRPRHCTSS